MTGKLSAVSCQLSACVLVAVACGDAKEPSPPQQPAAGSRQPPPVSRPPSAVTPDWRTRVPDIPGTAVLTWIDGPVVGNGRIRVGSSAVGVAYLDARTGVVVEQDQGARVDAARGPDVFVDDGAWTITRTSVERVSHWTHELDDEIDMGAGTPVVAGDVAAVVIDGQLVAFDAASGARRWAADGFALAAPLHAQTQITAVATGDGIGPVVVRPASGEVAERGDTVAARQVLSGARAGLDLALVVRRDAHMRRDAVVAFRGTTLQWELDLPRPDEPRVDPIGVLIADDAVFVFYDGRYVVRLPL